MLKKALIITYQFTPLKKKKNKEKKKSSNDYVSKRGVASIWHAMMNHKIIERATSNIYCDEPTH